MSLNSSSSSNDSLLHPNISFNDLNLPFYFYCFVSKPTSFIFTTYFITYILLLLPLCIFIIYHGLQQWRQKRSTSSAATMSHSDSFTYHVVIMELIGVFESVLLIYGIFIHNLNILFVGHLFLIFTWSGEMFFHILTCVERYLAVVHPITYLSLRKERGIRIRNISIGCVWMLCIVGTSVMMQKESLFYAFCLMIVSLTIVSFCSISVLRVLIRPGPGEQGRSRERVDQSKQRAFYTIMVILGVLVLRFIGGIIFAGKYVLGFSFDCMIMACEIWFILPSSLVLPLLFLHRAEKLMCCKKNMQ